MANEDYLDMVNSILNPLREEIEKEDSQKIQMIGSQFVELHTEEIGNPIYPPAQRELVKHGILGASHRARQITADDLQKFDRIYYMDRSNARYLQRLFPNHTDFLPFLPYDVADPWYSEDFSQTWTDIETGCKHIMEELL